MINLISSELSLITGSTGIYYCTIFHPISVIRKITIQQDLPADYIFKKPPRCRVNVMIKPISIGGQCQLTTSGNQYSFPSSTKSATLIMRVGSILR